ncbi:MAG: hypothetical protein ACRC9L_02975 [Brevinema sp.]
MSQLHKRQPDEYINKVLTLLNAQEISTADAMKALEISKARLYQLRTQWLKDGKRFKAKSSGGSRKEQYPGKVKTFILAALQAQLSVKPFKANYSFISDELLRRYDFKKSRTAIMRYAQSTYPQLLSDNRKKPRRFRRWQCSKAGKLWQHDSTPFKVGPLQFEASMLLTVDDATRQIIGLSIVPRENLDEHFTHFRKAFTLHGIPEGVYTDAFTMFGKAGEDIKTQCGRMFRSLEIAHIVATTPQAKGKVERSIGTFERRLLAAFMLDKATTIQEANLIAEQIVQHWNEHHVNRTTGKTPNEAFNSTYLTRKNVYRKADEALVDLCVARHIERKVSSANTIDFEGKNYQISPTDMKKVWLIYHHNKEFWVVESRPDPTAPRWSKVLGYFEL